MASNHHDASAFSKTWGAGVRSDKDQDIGVSRGGTRCGERLACLLHQGGVDSNPTSMEQLEAGLRAENDGLKSECAY